MVELRLQQSLFAERSANPSKSWTVVVCLAEVAAITNQHDCAAFEWALLEECDLTEYQLWAQRGLQHKRAKFYLHLVQFVLQACAWLACHK